MNDLPFLSVLFAKAPLELRKVGVEDCSQGVQTDPPQSQPESKGLLAQRISGLKGIDLNGRHLLVSRQALSEPRVLHLSTPMAVLSNRFDECRGDFARLSVRTYNQAGIYGWLVTLRLAVESVRFQT